MRWDELPQGVVVHPYLMNDNGSESSDLAFPISFSSTGRVITNKSHLTLWVYAYNPQDPSVANNRDMWRFIRLYPNTGRTVVARAIADLPD